MHIKVFKVSVIDNKVNHSVNFAIMNIFIFMISRSLLRDLRKANKCLDKKPFVLLLIKVMKKNVGTIS